MTSIVSSVTQQPNARQIRHYWPSHFRRLHQPVAATLLALTLICARNVPAQASDQCNPPNVIPQPVCDMDGPQGSPPRQVPGGWTPFVLSGDASYSVETSAGAAHTF